MNKFSAPLRMVDQQVELGKSLGVLQLSIDSKQLDGRIINSQGIDLINFGSCSYMGLETEQRLRDAAIKAINDFGTQYSSSRSYVQLGLYDELENEFEKIFGKPTILAPSTSMGHFSAIPVLVSRKDAVILDHQVHASVQTAISLVKAVGTHVEHIPHNDMKILEERVAELSKEFDSVWYMCDGIYSMFGDLAPLKELEQLLEKYPNLYLYIDDAHGVGWYGQNGRGYVLEHMDFHPRMVLTASTSKSFGAGGGVIVFPNEEAKRMVRNCGGTLMFSGPLQPPVLGTLLESLKLHQTEEIKVYQNELVSNIKHFIQVATELELPVASDDLTPVFFIGAGTPQTLVIAARKVLDLGYYLNISSFPAVPYKKTGFRVTITRHQTKEDISNFLKTLSVQLQETLKDNNIPYADIFKAFGLPLPKRLRVA